MNRRDFALGLGASPLAALLAAPAWAQGGPQEGRDYTRLQQPQPVPGGGKVEAVEFFGYWCPHCHAFEPQLDAWARKLPADVVFRRIPVAFNEPQKLYQRLFYALEAMGLLDTLHRKVFTAFHVQNQRLEKESELQALCSANGVDFAKLTDTMKSFSVATKCNQATQAAKAWAIDGVPTLGVQGRFVTSVGLAGSHERALMVMDALIQKARKM